MRTLGADTRPTAPLDNIGLPRPSSDERQLAPASLRRYVTYCARRDSERQARNATALWNSLAAPQKV